MKNKGNIALWTLVAIIILAAILVLGNESKKKNMELENTVQTEEVNTMDSATAEADLSAEIDSIGSDLDSTDVESLDEDL